MHIGKAIAQIRELRNILRKSLAFDMHVVTETIGYLERITEVPRLTTLKRVCKILNVSVTAVVLHGLDEKEIPAEHLENFRNLKRDIL